MQTVVNEKSNSKEKSPIELLNRTFL